MTTIFGIERFTIANAVLFQILWFSCVVGAGANGWHWTAVLGVTLLTAATFLSPLSKVDFLLGVTALALGLIIDSIWIAREILIYPGYEYVPYWIGALWFGMGLTINHSLIWFRDRRILGPLVVGCFAPVTYLTGQRFGAVIVPELLPMLVVSLSWMLVFYVLAALSHRRIANTARLDSQAATS